MKLIIPKKKRIKILVLGTGGTGGYLIPHLYRLSYALSLRPQMNGESAKDYKAFLLKTRNIEIILADGDHVEEKNLLRQNFVQADLLKNKAEVMSRRYGGIYGVKTTYIPEYIESPGIITEELTTNDEDKFLPILIGCVDNNMTRCIMEDVFSALNEIIYIDAGNSEYHGQVVMGYKRKGEVVLPSPATVYPDLLDTSDPDEKFRSVQSCSNVTVSSPQNMMANIMAANIIMGYINNIAVLSVIEVSDTLFSSRTMNCRSKYV